MNKTAIIRCEHFNAAHRLHNINWSDEKNREVFGKCNNPNYHGHNYNIEVKVIGLCNPNTGYVIDAKILSDLIKDKVLNRFDHKNLNEEVPEFLDLIPTAENMAIVIYQKLIPHLNDKHDLSVTLYETPRNYVTFSG